jgi:hypothetical protein
VHFYFKAKMYENIDEDVKKANKRKNNDNEMR